MIYPGSLQTHFRSSPFRILSRIGPVFVRCWHSECARRWYSCVNRSSGKHETGKWIADDDNNCTALPVRRLGEHVFFLEVY